MNQLNIKHHLYIQNCNHASIFVTPENLYTLAHFNRASIVDSYTFGS